jgi:amino acid transporter
MIVSTFGFMTATMLSTPRTLYALAADGFLPRSLALVHPVHRTPHVAITAQAIIVYGIALTGTYVRLAQVASVAVLLVYLACCVGAWRLRRLDIASESKPFRMPAGEVVPWVAAALMIGLLVRATAEAWLLTVAVAAAASLLFLLQQRRGSRATG